MQQTRSGNWIFAIPSFWGLGTWTLALSAFLFGGMGWFPPDGLSLGILLLMPLFFIASLMFYGPVFKSLFDHHYRTLFPSIRLRWEMAFHLVGIVAAVMVVRSINASGLIEADYFTTFLENPMAIRRATTIEVPDGNYLGYAGWLGAFISGVQAGRKKKGRWIHFALLAIQVAANMVFVSKIRPISVILLFAFPYLIANYRRYGLSRILTLGTALLALIVGFFLVWSDSTGKVYGLGLGYPPAVETFLLYLSSGPAYFSQIVAVEVPDMDLSRTLRPFYTLSAILFGTEPPPSPIIPFYSIPFTTNVGTALEPWYRDVGLVGVVAGMFTLSFVVDLVAYWGLLFRRTTGFLITVMMCLCSALAFFAPRLTTGAVIGALMLFALHALIVAMATLMRPRRSREDVEPAAL